MSIKASELRIGNLVCPDDISVVTAIRNNGFIDIETIASPEDDYCTKVIEDIKPIPLSEEWLLKFGFDKFEGYDFETKHLKLVPVYIKDDVPIMLSGGQYWYVIRQYDGGTSDPYEAQIEIHTVHQLQNLYTSLVGEELTIKA